MDQYPEPRLVVGDVSSVLVVERLIAKASVEQRCALGFPWPGHSYWTQETIAAVQACYGSLGIDMTSYEHALAVRPGDAAP